MFIEVTVLIVTREWEECEWANCQFYTSPDMWSNNIFATMTTISITSSIVCIMRSKV